MKPSDLKEMDIVVRRDGMLCWVLYNSIEGGLYTFHHCMYAQYAVNKYFNNFNYGKNVEHFIPKRDSQYDIIAVIRPKTYWHAINAMRNYENDFKLPLDENETKEKRIADFINKCQALDWVWFRENFDLKKVITRIIKHAEYMLPQEKSNSDCAPCLAIRRMDDLGRIVIPKEIRQKAFNEPDLIGVPFEIYSNKENEVILKKHISAEE